MSKELDYIADLERENRTLTDKIADIKANCDLAIEGRDVKIMELTKQIEKMRKKEELKKVASVWNYLRTVGAETRIEELEQQIEKMKRHCNCKHRDSEGYCEVKRTYLMDLSYDGCDKWELED